MIGDGTTIGNAGWFSNMEVRNCQIEKAFIGVYANGGTTPQQGASLTCADNALNTSGANAIRLVGLYMQGVNGATVTNNTIGNFGATDGENDIGIWLATGATNATVSGNTVTGLGYTGTSAFAPIGIDVTSGVSAANVTVSRNTVTNISTNGTTAVRGIASPVTGTADVVIERNNVSGVSNTNTSTYGAYGIDVAAGNNHVVRNNFVSDVKFNMTGGAAFSTTFGVFGIRVGSGTGHVIAGNSVNLFGALPGTTATSLLSAALCVVGTSSTGMDIRDNLLANTLSGGSSSIAHVSACLPSGGASSMGLTWNNNAYYCGSTVAAQGIAQVGTTAGTGFYLPTDFNRSATTPSTNLRAYTSTLSAAGTNDDASLASTAAAPYASTTDLHVPTNALTPVSNAGAAVAGLTNDFDGDVRAATPDIGADEFTIYTLATNTVGAGSVAVSPSQTAYPAGATVTLTATPADACQEFAGWSGGASGTTNPLTLTMDADKSITATFATKSYAITASAGTGGGITPAGVTNVTCGTDQTFAIAATTGYHVADVLVDGVSAGAVASYTFTNVQATHTIAASFAPDVVNWTITASAGAGGSISPDGAVTVAGGADQAFAITAGTGYHVADVLVDGVSVGAVASYTFSAVGADHTIAASFALDTYTIVASAGTGGTITPSGTLTYSYGDDPSFAIAATTGYHVADVLVDGVSVGAVGTYAFTDVAANHTIAASFALDTYTIVASAGTGGTITPSGTLTYSYGDSPSLAFSADAGFHLDAVVVDGVNLGIVSSPYTFPSIAANHTIDVQFAANPPVAAITNLAAAQQPTANDADGTTRIHLSWTPRPSGTVVHVYRAGFGAYPEYDDSTGVAPLAPGVYPPSVAWTLAGTAGGPGGSFVDEPGTRDFWYYAAYVVDGYGTVSAASNVTAGTLNYHLGDVSDGSTSAAGDNAVDMADVSRLGAHYGLVGVAVEPYHDLDVGPTADFSTVALPTTDNRINFEDLMMFIVNFSVVSMPASSPTASTEVTMETPADVTADHFTVRLWLKGAGDVKGLSARLAWDATMVEPVSFAPGELLDRQGAVAFCAEPGVVDVGATSAGLTGDGPMANVTFRRLRAGDARITLASVDARDGANRPTVIALGERRAVPAVTAFRGASPNPFRGTTTLAFALAQGGAVDLSLYSVDGRRVRTLVGDTRAAGEYRITWDGRDDAGHRAAPGVYYARLVTSQGTFVRATVRVE